MKITIKGTKATKEYNISSEGINFTVGVKVYTTKELNKVRKEYLKLLNTSDLDTLEKLKDESTEIDAAHLDKIEQLAEKKEEELIAFYRKHIVYLKNISLETDEGDLIIADTREIQPIEGLWENSEQCLVVLLDLYFDNVSIAPLINNAVTKVVFDASYKEEAIKN